MAQCPNCSKTISITEDNFGTLYRCEHCQTEFFIGFDGVPENSKEPLPGDEPLPEPAAPVTPLEMPSVEFSAMPEPSNSSSDLFNISSSPEPTPLNYPEVPSYAPPAETQNEAQSMSSGLGTAAQDDMASPMPQSSVFQDFANDVQNFGNDTSMTGVLSFDIEISGIDLADMKKDLLEALDDQRFGWNMDEVTQKISNGTLKLENISAPKIIVLVKRITPIGLTLNWRHHVSTQ